MQHKRVVFSAVLAMLTPVLAVDGVSIVPAVAVASGLPSRGPVTANLPLSGIAPSPKTSRSPAAPSKPTPHSPSGGASPPPARGGNPAGGPVATPEKFPVGFFAPYFIGPISRTFSRQYIQQIGGYVEVTYPAGATSPSSGLSGGAQAQLHDAAGALTTATLTYQVRFPVGFTWVKGGKLPGLCGGTCWTGSNNGPGGWTTRFMWRSGGAGEVLLSDATTTGYGSDLGKGLWYFKADGAWHTISQRIHLNTPGAADGYIDVTYDGALVAYLTGITFRTSATTVIDSLMFSTFFGGHDSTWAPTTTQHIDFAAFRLTP